VSASRLDSVSQLPQLFFGLDEVGVEDVKALYLELELVEVGLLPNYTVQSLDDFLEIVFGLPSLVVQALQKPENQQRETCFWV
jgi:hypothetical protein